MNVRCVYSSIAAITLAFTSVSSAYGEIIYGAGQQEPETIYEIDTVAQTVTPICLITPSLAPDNLNFPNGLSFDVDNQRLYFSINTDAVEGSPSSLYFCDLITNSIEYAGELVGQAAGGTFDQLNGQYVYIRNGTDDLAAVTLDPVSGLVVGELILVPDFSGDTVVFRGGDIAIDCSGVLFGSSLGSVGGSKAFFKIDLRNGNVYTLIHEDPSGDNSNTGYATAKQISFAEDGTTLFAQKGGRYWQVDKSDGLLSSPIDIPAVSPVGMTDLATSADCVCASDLIAGGGTEESGIDVGDVLITKNSDGTFSVRLETTGTWEIGKVHVHVACELADIPQTRSGNPKIGNFDYSKSYEPLTQVAILNVLSPACSECEVLFAVHAEVFNGECTREEGKSCETKFEEYSRTTGGKQEFIREDYSLRESESNDANHEECNRKETAWGDGPEFGGQSWATYIECKECN